jgi:hypothetical protein
LLSIGAPYRPATRPVIPNLSGVRIAVVLSSLAALAVAGCGARADHAARQPARTPADHVFTVPDKLPPRARAAAARPAPALVATGTGAAAGAPSDAEVQRELAQALGMHGKADIIDQAGLDAQGMAIAPPSAPAKVAAIIDAGNQVARAPYRYGGGHGGVAGRESWVDSAYDCSGSVSFALAGAGLLDRQLDSTSFMSWGAPGPGRWVTIFANQVHAFMVVAGLRFDTIERAQTGTRWGAPYTKVTGFAVRHPPGL